MTEVEPRGVDCLVLSPHLDDAALSLGAGLWRLAQQGKHVLVVTLATDEPRGPLSAIAQDLHRRWGLEQGVMKQRGQEDKQASSVLGVEALHLGLTDALYRSKTNGEPLYPSFRALFGPPRREDSAWSEELVERLRQLPVAHTVCAPLAAGHHVDHRLTRLAAEMVYGKAVRYYEDFPYASNRWVRWKALGWPLGWTSEIWPTDPTALDAKCRAIACYDSQLGTAFAGLEDMERRVRDFAAARGGERLWIRGRSGKAQLKQ